MADDETSAPALVTTRRTRGPRGTCAPWVRLVREQGEAYGLGTEPLSQPERVAAFARARLGGEEVEVVLAVYLDARNRVLGCSEVSRGTLTAALLHPREVFRTAIALGAYSLVLAHNHPSGDATPSQEDQAITRRLQQAGELLGIRLVDHVVIGAGAAGSWRSLQAEGWL
jgi:DNA repair protein RadC